MRNVGCPVLNLAGVLHVVPVSIHHLGAGLGLGNRRPDRHSDERSIDGNCCLGPADRSLGQAVGLLRGMAPDRALNPLKNRIADAGRGNARGTDEEFLGVGPSLLEATAAAFQDGGVVLV